MLRRPARPSPRPGRGARGLVAAGAALAVAAAGAGTTGVALAASTAPAVPTVFITQLISGDGGTTLRHAVQSRLANAGAGGVQIVSIGTAASSTYNAVGYRTVDDDLYGIAATSNVLVQVHSADGAMTSLGAVTGLPVPSAGSYAAGAFGAGDDADVLFVKANSATSDVYAVDVATRTVIRTIDPSQDFNAIDLTWSDGFLWGVEVTTSGKTLIRLDVSDGTVTRIATGSVFPATDPNSTSSGYGAAWTYGNGNLAFSNNGTGAITQVRVQDATAPMPTLARVSTITGPSTTSNDGATSPSSPANLELTVTPPAPAAPHSPITWEVVVTNDGPGGSSGGVFQFDVPAGVTDVDVPDGCTLTGAHVQCVSGQLPDGTSDTYAFSGTSPAAATVGSSSVITVIGNELDTTEATASLVVAPAARTLSSTGPGPVPQSVASGVPAGGTATLLDGNGGPVATLPLPGTGTYAVSGSSFTFTPDNGWTGTAPAVAFRLTATDGSTGTGTYTATVTPPAAPVAGDRTTTGVGTAPQSTTVTPAPAGGSLTLLDGSTPVSTLTVTGGTYALDAATATITFTPDLGYTGSPAPATYRVRDAYAQQATGTHRPTVTAPAAPSASPATSTGVGTDPQSPATAVTVPDGGSVTLLDGSTPVTTLTVPDEGTHALDAATGVLTFTPVLGFSGTATAVHHRVTDAYGQSDESTYTATVTAPSGPAAPPRTSTGVGTAAQGATVTVPASGAVTLLDADGDPVTSLTVAGQGGYVLDPATGAITFTPVLGFSGPATAVDYRVTDAYGTSAEGEYAPTVTRPAAPVVPDRATSGPAASPQGTTVTLPAGGTLVLLDDGTPRTSLTVAGQGTYEVVGADRVRFTPVVGFSGPATPVTTRVTDAYGQAVTATWTATVVPPAAPPAPAVTSSGTGTQAHTVGLPVPAGGAVTLLDGSTPVSTLTVPGEGTYTLDPATGVVTFAPAVGFSGTARGVAYRVTDVYGQTATGTAVPTVAKPSAPTVSRLSTAGQAGVAQRATAIPVPAGGSVTLVDASGAAADTVVVAGQGTYSLDRGTGVVTFTPEPGFSGEAAPVTYRVADAYGQVVEGSYGASVEAAPAAPAPAAAGLASTGTDALPLLVLAGFLVVGGAVLVVVGRQRGRAEELA
ncbi:DUF6923 family protein [Geodermatophilus amargosae]|uniref:DUF6923 family protein n=1 Tax=Geodermatophilus amargosae TaxID=1296565 RepID=UPI0034E0026F